VQEEQPLALVLVCPENPAVAFRGLVGLMIHQLPLESRRAIGDLLMRSVSDEGGETPHGYYLLSELMRLQDPSLDKMPDASIVSINLRAPLRTIVNAIEVKVREWKAERGILETRRRDDKVPQFLQVWDLREGWGNDHYEGRQEKTFREISRELGITVSTAANRYRSAFRYLTGYDYRPGLWARLFAALKVSELVNRDSRPRLAARRPWRSPGKREVPETVITGDRRGGALGEADAQHGGTFLDNMATVREMIASADLVMDVQTLLAKGYNDARIASELEENPDKIADLVQSLRRRHEDKI
jgi:hypothetical protein